MDDIALERMQTSSQVTTIYIIDLLFVYIFTNIRDQHCHH
jgi:hypothetical protein